jgi:predicted PolB exonuclease-like 3'-5' exonuclease
VPVDRDRIGRTSSEPLAGLGNRRHFREGRIEEIADYCETDVINTYRVWLRYELFRGRLTDPEYEASEQNLIDFSKARAISRHQLAIP